MKRIGFIDHYLDEWHANNYPNWIADPRYGGRYEVAYAWAAMEKTGGLTTSEWCAKYGVEQACTQEELVEKSDCIIVLSPDNPEQHEALAALALRSGKPVYVDKPFAINRRSADSMFNLAEKHGTPMYSTSALRYAEELHWLAENRIAQRGITFASTCGPGQFENYAIHQIEMIVAAMGTGVKRVIAHGGKDVPAIAYEYRDGRCCFVNMLSVDGFSVILQSSDGKARRFDVTSNFWDGFIADLLSFFDTGIPPVPREETCEAVSMVEAGLAALKKPGEWIELH